MKLHEIMTIISHGDVCDGNKPGMPTRSFVISYTSPMCARRPGEKYYFNKTDFDYDWEINAKGFVHIKPKGTKC